MAGERVCSSGFADHISERRQGDGELPRRGGRRRAVAIKRYVAVLQGIDGDIGAERRVRGVEGEQDFLPRRSEEHTSELQSLMRISYAVFCLKKKTTKNTYPTSTRTPQRNYSTITDNYNEKQIETIT